MENDTIITLICILAICVVLYFAYKMGCKMRGV